MLVSLGAGILVFVIGLFSILLVWKILNSPAWMTTGIVWMLVWPIRLLLFVICIPYPDRGGTALALTIGIAADVAILSRLIYVALSLFSGKPSRPSLPPPPPAYQ